jgi:hypothetical protein
VEPSTASEADRRSEGLQPWLVSLQSPFLLFIALLISYLVLFSAALSTLTQRCSDAEEKYTQSQADLNQTFAFLDSARTLNSSLNAQLDSEKMAYEVNFLDCFCFAFFPSMLSAILTSRRRDKRSLLLTTIWTDYIVTPAIP